MFKKDHRGQFILQWPLKDGDKFTFTRGRVLGKGGFGKCYEILEEKTRNKYACKIIDKFTTQYKKTKEKVQSEIIIHERLKNENIVKFQRCFEDQQFIYILLELCINNTLDEVLNRRKILNQVQVRYYLYQILKGVKYLHQEKIVHRDLKLQNFFISEQMEIKIGDFGLATYMNSHQRRKSICGTPNYMAPQIFSDKNGYSYQIDIWSLGIVTFLLLSGKFPFQHNDLRIISNEIKNKSYFSKIYMSDTAKSLITKMLILNPCQRYTIKQLLKHDFFILYQIPITIPRSCLACLPTACFIEQYKFKKNIEEDTNAEFCFMLESRQSPATSNRLVQLSGIKINSGRYQEFLHDSAKRICSFGYQSHRNDSCNIKKWISDYWQYPRYGLLYKISDGCMGIRFNDGSNMILINHQKTKFKYISKTGKVILIDIREQTSKQILIKTKILGKLIGEMHFEECASYDDSFFIRLYSNSLEVFVIWLNNGMIQGVFEDQSQIIIGMDSCMYIDSSKQVKNIFPSKNINDQDLSILTKNQLLQKTIKRISTINQQSNHPNKQNLPSKSNH